MKLGTRARYSLRLMMEVARLSDGRRPVNLQEIATWTGISRRYLEQLVIPLRNASLLRGRSGRNGGHVLARPPEEIALRDIIEAASGPVVLAECVDTPSVCRLSKDCACRKLWTLISLRIKHSLDDCSLADMVDPEWLGKQLALESKRAGKRTTSRREARVR